MLQIARALTRAFPEEGTVWARSLEIIRPTDSPLPLVSCSGKARSNEQWLAMRGRLSEIPGVEDLRFREVTAEIPLQFTVEFQWNGDAAHGS
jgi:hypothetical protein